MLYSQTDDGGPTQHVQHACPPIRPSIQTGASRTGSGVNSRRQLARQRDVKTSYVRPTTSSSLYRCVTIQMEDEVRLLLLLLLRLNAAAVSQLVSRRRVPDNGAATMWQSGAASPYNLKRPRRPENADTERLAPTCFQAGRRTRCPNLILVFKTCVIVIFWFVGVCLISLHFIGFCSFSTNVLAGMF